MKQPAADPPPPLLQTIPVAPRLWVPLESHRVGALPGAKVGATVRRGEPLSNAHAEGFAAPLAPADGMVVAVEPVELLDGREVPAAVLETTQGAEVPPGLVAGDAGAGAADAAPAADLFGEITASERGAGIEALRRAGIWADRWTSPDLIAQLHQSLRRPIDTVLCSVLDTDRALPLQTMLADAYDAALAAGVDRVAKVAGAHKAWVLADAALPDAFLAALRKTLEQVGARLVPLRNDYPQANPTLLQYTVLNRRLPPGHLPTETGTLVLDAAAAVAVGRFVLHREAMLTVPVAVNDPRSGKARFVAAPVGTPLSDILGHLGLLVGDSVLYGGPPPRDLKASPGAVVSGTELSLYVAPPPADPNPDPCIRCGWCVEGCPVHIHPAALLEAMQRDDMDLADDAGLHACIDCGVCSYICPSRLPLLGGIRTLRKRWAEQMGSGR